MKKYDLGVSFSKDLDKMKVSHRVLNNGYHIQVMVIHNFYPSKKTYYNSDTGRKCKYNEFKNQNELFDFLKEDYIKPEVILSKESVIKILNQCGDLKEAIMHFKQLN